MPTLWIAARGYYLALNRTPPKPVRAALAKEVGFGCPVEDCRSPYLTWHHFDPPWSDRQHHNPDGMIALCREHHDNAGAGAYTPEQLFEMKARGHDRAQALSGHFQWRRRRLLAVVGGAFYYETPIAVQLRDRPIVSFSRDEQDHVLLNVDMPSTVREARLRIDDNFWIEVGQPESLECPPSGRIVSLTYGNGDAVRVEFYEAKDGEALSKRYAGGGGARRFLEEEEPQGFPVTVVDVRMRIHGPDARPVIDFDAQETRVGGGTLRGILSVRNAVGLQLG